MSDKERGLYPKYRVERTDGKQKGPYFVLAYATDPLAARALAVYANLAEEAGYHQLAADLRIALQASAMFPLDTAE